MQKPLAHGNRIKLADEFIQEARAEFQNPGIYADLAGVEKFLSMKPAAYATTKEFVLQFMQLMIEYWTTHKIRIHPYFALCYLLTQLDTVKNRSIFAVPPPTMMISASEVMMFIQNLRQKWMKTVYVD
ncbi:hypothetical protein N7528_003248 [Penicillium herquei]|nr:hypothetical protein N7528_003248 [Penicillium herquei]